MVTLFDFATSEKPREWNPRYVAYAKAHGKTPEEMLALEIGENHKFVNFIIWIHGKWAAFDKRHPDLKIRTERVHDIFDRELMGEVCGI